MTCGLCRACFLQVFGFDQSDQRFVVGAVVLVGDGRGVVHGRPGLLPKPGVADGSDGIAELAVDAAAVVELLVGVARGALVLDAADATDAHDEDDEHEDEGHAESPDDDVERVAGHVGQGFLRVGRLPLQVDLAARSHPAGRAVAGEAVGLVDAGASVVAGVTLTLVHIHLTALPQVSRWTVTGCVEPRALAAPPILAVDPQTGVSIHLTVPSFILRCAYTLVCVDEVSAGGVVLAGG